ncbi:hypothetical protein SELMODRAFT_429502 [Selaginella moellendorffii]|uniref:Uncharacterized protein n=1 Tax=Selaginella moellendorffii TaxID=88036 RepID=D8T6D9_SELML|nr:hypothetical protein SELMODRAFT_429502 [Selaginella moellendorffii]
MEVLAKGVRIDPDSSERPRPRIKNTLSRTCGVGVRCARVNLQLLQGETSKCMLVHAALSQMFNDSDRAYIKFRGQNCQNLDEIPHWINLSDKEFIFMLRNMNRGDAGSPCTTETLPRASIYRGVYRLKKSESQEFSWARWTLVHFDWGHVRHKRRQQVDHFEQGRFYFLHTAHLSKKRKVYTLLVPRGNSR